LDITGYRIGLTACGYRNLDFSPATLFSGYWNHR